MFCRFYICFKKYRQLDFCKFPNAERTSEFSQNSLPTSKQLQRAPSLLERDKGSCSTDLLEKTCRR